jgi:hypothetical protein
VGSSWFSSALPDKKRVDISNCDMTVPLTLLPVLVALFNILFEDMLFELVAEPLNKLIINK